MAFAHLEADFAGTLPYEKIQGFLDTILHANECWCDGVYSVCPNSKCLVMKLLLVHIKDCNVPHCTVPNCKRIKRIFQHWSECTSTLNCIICKPYSATMVATSNDQITPQGNAESQQCGEFSDNFGETVHPVGTKANLIDRVL